MDVNKHSLENLPIKLVTIFSHRSRPPTLNHVGINEAYPP